MGTVIDNGKTSARRFLDAFNRIEQVLRSRSAAGAAGNGRAGFAQLVKESRDLNARQRERLLEYGDLQNIIVHQPYDEKDEPYADPRISTVEWMEAQADIIERPPIVMTVLKLQPPQVLHAEDDVSAFFDLVRLPFNFSQAPVATPGGLQLITTNAVARWISASYEHGAGVALDSAPLAEVLKFAENGDRLLVKPAKLKAVEALRVFAGEAGEPPAAILLTQHGRSDEKPLGLCVRADVPDLRNSLRV